MAYTTLIDTDALAAHIANPAFAIVDCRYNPNDEAWGRAAYLAEHIPGAVFADMDRDLAGPKTGTNGRHPLPDPATLKRTFSRLGIASDGQAVVYDQDAGMYASRLWWLLRWLGHDAVAVLNGGLAKWLAEGRPTSAGEETRKAREFTGSPRPEMSLDADQVMKLFHYPDWRLLDARAPERYRGETEPIDRIAGHIPGARNHFYMRNVDEAGAFRSRDELHHLLSRAVGDIRPDHVVCYCGSGVTACHNLLALEHAGFRGAKLYPGSWSEWSSDPARPIGRGGET